MNYNEYIVYNDNMLRPKIKNIGISVHKIVDQVENTNRDYDDIIDHYYLSKEKFSKSESKSQPVSKDEILNKKMIEACIKFYNENEQLIDEIIKEDNKLRNALFDQDSEYFNPDKVKSNIEDLDLKYFDVSVNVDSSSSRYEFEW